LERPNQRFQARNSKSHVGYPVTSATMLPSIRWTEVHILITPLSHRRWLVIWYGVYAGNLGCAEYFIRRQTGMSIDMMGRAYVKCFRGSGSAYLSFPPDKIPQCQNTVVLVLSVQSPLGVVPCLSFIFYRGVCPCCSLFPYLFFNVVLHVLRLVRGQVKVVVCVARQVLALTLAPEFCAPLSGWVVRRCFRGGETLDTGCTE
jgi:hypothetical protein